MYRRQDFRKNFFRARLPAQQYSTVNLSDYQPSIEELNILEKGLTFIPTPKVLPVSNFIQTKRTLIRNIKLNSFFKNSTKTFHKKPFSESKKWSPPTALLDNATLKLIDEIELTTENILNSWSSKNDQNASKFSNIFLNEKLNLNSSENKCIKSLKSNTNLVIKQADKGGATVLINRQNYVAEAQRQLSDTKYYQKLREPIFQKNITKIKNILNNMLTQKFIDEDQFKFLSGPEDIRPRNFYLLPKIHKPQSKWPQPGRMPEGRPIVSDVNSETYRISQYIDSFINPLACQHKTYIKNTYDFLSKIRNFKVSDSYLLVTGDITALYTNMNLNRTIDCVKNLFTKNPDPNRPDSHLIELLEISLKNNDFQFIDNFYLQITGTAMGKRFAPALANIYLLEFDERAMNGFPIKPLLFFRFLDDIFFIWPGSTESLKEYNNFLNTLIPDITVTLDCNETEVNFLDTTIFKANNTLQSKVYFKTTDTHQLLHTSSHHPKHTFKGIIKSQLIRFKRISSYKKDFDNTCKILFGVLTQRGYKHTVLRNVKNDIWYNYRDPIKNDQISSTTNNNKLLPIVIDYSSLGTKLAQQYKDLMNKSKLFKNTRIITAYKTGNKLSNLLIRSKLPTIKQGLYLKCDDLRCKTCTLHSKNTSQIHSSANKNVVKLDQNLHCGTQNIVYIITCRKCKAQYIGETNRKLKERLTDHRSAINLNKNTPIGIHFNSPNHNILDLEIAPIEKIENYYTDSYRKEREKFWQLHMGTKYPQGLNNYPIEN